MAISRRRFLQTAGAVSLLIPLSSGVRAALLLQESQPPDKNYELNDWIWVGPANRVVVGVSQCEVGQGIFTGLAGVVSAEMDADWSLVDVVFVTNRDAYRQVAGGEDKAQFVAASTSMTNFYQRVRKAGAQARVFFLQAAAREWGIPAEQCRTEKSYVFDTKSERKASYASLVHWATSVPLQKKPAFKSREQEVGGIIGQPLRRVNTPEKVDGSAIFGMDIQLPDMLVGVPWMVPSLNGRIVSVRNEQTIKALPGIVAVVWSRQQSTLNLVKLDPDTSPNTLIVVAESYWQAKKAADLLDVEFSYGEKDNFSSETIRQDNALALREADMVVAFRRGDAPALISGAQNSQWFHEGYYRSGYVAHATMEPCNATVFVEDNKITAWGPFQGQDFVRILLGSMFKLDRSLVTVNTTFLGGSFGRKYTPDAAMHAAVASAATGRPVKVIYPREIDIQHGFFRPGNSSHYRALLGKDGFPVALWARYAGQGLHWQLQRSRVVHNGGWDETIVDCAYSTDYDIPALQVEEKIVEQGIPLTFLRGVGSVASLFFLESFISELSYKVGIDELAYRQRLLKNSPLMRRVMEETARKAGWSVPLPAHRFRGLAVNTWLGRDDAFVSYVAAVAEIELTGDQWRVTRIVCGVDCGKIINPNLVRATIEGGLGFALTGALYSKVTFDRGCVMEGNFHQYGLLSLKDMPDITVVLLDSDRSPQGCGEITTAVLAPALASALHQATGQRWQELPFPATLSFARGDNVAE